MFEYGFCDLNVDIEGADKNAITAVCKRLRQYGFRTVALNININDENFKKEKKKKGKQNQEDGVVPRPYPVNSIEEIGGLKILNRLTVTLKDSSQLYQLRQSAHYNKYHLIAVIPQNQNILQQVCGLNEVDIISFEAESRPPYKLNRKLYNLAVEKRIFFEISYSPLIADKTCRKNIISVAHQYFTFGKSRNIIITSGSRYPFNLVRGPYDIVHLGLIFGLNDVKTKETILKNCSELIYRSEVRRKKKSCLSSFTLSQDILKESNVAQPDQNNKEEQDEFELPLKKVKLGYSNIESKKLFDVESYS